MKQGRRMRSGLLALPLALVVIASAVWLIGHRNRSTPIALVDAVRQFRHESHPSARSLASHSKTTPTPASRDRPTDVRREAERSAPTGSSDNDPSSRADGFGRPTEGVYTYTTNGFETLTGSRHDYPKQTHAAVRWQGPCVWSFTHDVIEEHRDAYESCNGSDRVDLTEWFLRRDFLGVTMEEEYACAGSELLSSSDASGDRLALTCRADDEDRIDVKGLHREPESLTVGNELIEAVRLSVRGVISGNPDGEMRIELWLDPTTGLRLRETRVVDAQVSAGVSGRYHEEAEFIVTSRRPST